MIEKREKIKHKAADEEAWICICKNTITDSGFLLCNEEGNEVEPTRGNLRNGLYICIGCGRIIDSKTLEVLGCNPDFKQLS